MKYGAIVSSQPPSTQQLEALRSGNLAIEKFPESINSSNLPEVRPFYCPDWNLYACLIGNSSDYSDSLGLRPGSEVGSQRTQVVVSLFHYIYYQYSSQDPCPAIVDWSRHNALCSSSAPKVVSRKKVTKVKETAFCVGRSQSCE